jgi:hypothetical protein
VTPRTHNDAQDDWASRKLPQKPPN